MLLNKTTKKKIIDKTFIAKTPWQKMKGLMFEDAKKFNYGLIFCLPRESIANSTIHMLFVFFPIDLVYLNKDKKVVDIAKNILPFSLGYAPKKPSKYFVELPVGKSKKIKLGDELQW